MACMSTNTESPRRDYGYSSKLINCIVDSGTTCNTTTDIYNFIPGSFLETDKYIKVADEHLSQKNKQEKFK